MNVAIDERPFWFDPDASAEVLSAHNRYTEVTIELAARFQDELDRSRQTIASNPLTWPAYLCGTQRYLMKSFPFFIVFRVTKTRIEIIAVAHERQRPGYCPMRHEIVSVSGWKGRHFICLRLPLMFKEYWKVTFHRGA